MTHTMTIKIATDFTPSTCHAELCSWIDGVRWDSATGKASGFGYDRESTAVDKAISKCPLVQTLGLWKNFKHAGTKSYSRPLFFGLREKDYGYEFDIAGKGMSTLIEILTTNGFHLSEGASRSARFYCFERRMPDSFLSLI